MVLWSNKEETACYICPTGKVAVSVSKEKAWGVLLEGNPQPLIPTLSKLTWPQSPLHTPHLIPVNPIDNTLDTRNRWTFLNTTNPWVHISFHPLPGSGVLLGFSEVFLTLLPELFGHSFLSRPSPSSMCPMQASWPYTSPAYRDHFLIWAFVQHLLGAQIPCHKDMDPNSLILSTITFCSFVSIYFGSSTTLETTWG